MISSLVWLLLIKLKVIDPIHAPWEIYIPSLIFEVIMDCIFAKAEQFLKDSEVEK